MPCVPIASVTAGLRAISSTSSHSSSLWSRRSTNSSTRRLSITRCGTAAACALASTCSSASLARARSTISTARREASATSTAASVAREVMPTVTRRGIPTRSRTSIVPVSARRTSSASSDPGDDGQALAGQDREAVTRPPAQLLLYRFGANAGFEGRLVGALERIESGGTLRVLDALFVRLDPETEELTAIDVHGRGRGGFVEPLLNFRLDPDTRRRTTEQALASDAGATLSELAATLEPGTAIAAVVVEHSWAHA